jgi:hypothetical protein
MIDDKGWTAVAFEQHESVEKYRESGGIFVKKHPYRSNAYKVIEGIYVPHANPEMAERSGKDYLFNHHTIKEDQIKEYDLDDRWTFTDALVEEMMNNSAPRQEDHVANYWEYLNDQGISRDTLDRSTEEVYGGVMTTQVEEFESVDAAEKELKQRFKDFEENGETFFFEATVNGTDGHTAIISVDWATDWEDDFRNVANVIAYKEDQPSTEMEEVKESDAVMTAENVIKRAAEGLSYYNKSGVKPRINAEYEDRGDSITGFIDIQWRKMREAR